jgi:hypothetical protein
MHIGLFKKIVAGLVITAFLLFACKQTLQVLTKEEALAFGKAIENSIKKGNGELLDNSFNREEFIKKMNLPNTSESSGFVKGIMQKLTLGSQLVSILKDRDNFEVIKNYVKEGRQHIIFRMYTDKDGSLNYHDYELIKVNGECRIADVYIYMSGETLAETLGNTFNSLFQKSADVEQKKLTGLAEVKEIKLLMNKGKNADAKKIYDDLPGYLKKTKMVLLLNILVCSNLTADDYNAAIKSFQEKFPNEPNMNLMMIDGYYLQKDYAKMLAAVNALDAQINKDPLLDYHRYLSYNLLEDEKNSLLCLRRLVKNMPDLQKGYIELIAVNLKNNNKKEADSLIAIYRNKPKFNQEELNTTISYYQ